MQPQVELSGTPVLVGDTRSCRFLRKLLKDETSVVYHRMMRSRTTVIQYLQVICEAAAVAGNAI